MVHWFGYDIKVVRDVKGDGVNCLTRWHVGRLGYGVSPSICILNELEHQRLTCRGCDAVSGKIRFVSDCLQKYHGHTPANHCLGHICCHSRDTINISCARRNFISVTVQVDKCQ